MALVRIEGRGAMQQSLCQESRRSNRHYTILLPLPQEHLLEGNFSDLKAPRSAVNHSVLRIRVGCLSETLSRGLGKSFSDLWDTQQLVVCLSQPRASADEFLLDTGLICSC